MLWNTPDLCDTYAEEIEALPPVYQNFGGKPAFFGEVVTVQCFEDNSRVKELASTDGTGKVMVVDGGGSLRCALIGDLIAADAVSNGWQGIVIHGCCRDVHELLEMDFGVRALASIPVKSVRKGVGEVNQAIDMAGVTVQPGQWLYADVTGIIVASRALF